MEGGRNQENRTLEEICVKEYFENRGEGKKSTQQIILKKPLANLGNLTMSVDGDVVAESEEIQIMRMRLSRIVLHYLYRQVSVGTAQLKHLAFRRNASDVHKTTSLTTPHRSSD
jgi:hypothetical protein